MGSLLTLTRHKRGIGETVVQRVGAASASPIAYKIATQFTPADAVELLGVNDALQDDVTLVACVWNGAGDLLAASPPTGKAAGVHAARFAAPVTLAAATAYRIGWVATVSGNANAAPTPNTWAGFAVTSLIYYANNRDTTRPVTSFAGSNVPFDLVIAP